MMLQHKEADDFVVATGEAHSVREFVERTFGHLDLDWKKYVEIDSRYFVRRKWIICWAIRKRPARCLVGSRR